MCVRWRMALHSRRSSNSSLTNNTHYLSFTRYKLAALDSSRASKRRRLNGGRRATFRASSFSLSYNCISKWKSAAKVEETEAKKTSTRAPVNQRTKDWQIWPFKFLFPLFFARRLVGDIIAASASRAWKKGGANILPSHSCGSIFLCISISCDIMKSTFLKHYFRSLDYSTYFLLYFLLDLVADYPLKRRWLRLLLLALRK